MFKKVAFTYYPVTDVARARKFYEETLGLKSGSVGNQGDNWWVEYDLPGGGCLALTNFTKEKPSDTEGGTIAFEVDDLDRLITDLKGKGVTFKSDVIHSPVCRMAVCLDSEARHASRDVLSGVKRIWRLHCEMSPKADMAPGFRFTECVFDGQFKVHRNGATVFPRFVLIKECLSGHPV
jgi:predicted enzyme related to lactoylglutathione lyase